MVLSHDGCCGRAQEQRPLDQRWEAFLEKRIFHGTVRKTSSDLPLFPGQGLEPTSRATADKKHEPSPARPVPAAVPAQDTGSAASQ
mmetsp:Transcript_78360/g.243401  ORF Transcript_78360/g.243401 Transcript_78360/m.243401 type:complete len:86 (-) Transcript_78360:119-376(-)